jgi:HD-GYP domain-containing protein (c-di-GMP phosphodiesterase class II)
MLWLRGINGLAKGRSWELPGTSRVGRMDHLEVCLDDPSVSRCHAEVELSSTGWKLRDLGSTNGTFLNGTRMGPGQWPLRVRDQLQFGDVVLLVEGIDRPSRHLPKLPQPDAAIQNLNKKSQDSSFHINAPIKMDSGVELMLEASSDSSWSDALISPLTGTSDPNTPPLQSSQALLALLQSSRHLMFVEREEDLLRSILEEAVKVLQAQRGAIVLSQPDDSLQVRAVVEGSTFSSHTHSAGSTFSKSLAERVYAGQQSILLQSVQTDVALRSAPSIHEGDMASVICVLLRTPRRVLGVLHLDRSSVQPPFTKGQLELADALAAQVSAGIEAAQLIQRQRQMFQETITVLGQVLELRDEYTGGHTRRVTRYALLLADAANLHPDEMEWLRLGAPLHDIGKIGIPDHILRKAGPLTPEEITQMRHHARFGADILASIPSLSRTACLARSHHEWWDGTGYPDRLSGEDIPLLARILALADVFDALTSHRPYRQPLGLADALAEMEKLSGRQFDPKLFQIFQNLGNRLLDAAN